MVMIVGVVRRGGVLLEVHLHVPPSQHFNDDPKSKKHPHNTDASKWKLTEKS